MAKAPYEERVEARAEFFQALGHPVRLLILNLVRLRPRHGEELAAILALKPATVSHHLARLTGAGLLQARKDQYYQVYSLAGDALARPLSELVQLTPVGLAGEVQEDAFRTRVLRAFFRRGALVRIPAQRKKRQVILEKLVESFEPGRDYPEREVNQILLEFHEDVATLRRELIATRLMERQRGVYRRLPPAEPGPEGEAGGDASGRPR